jgi:hypothetical protein
VRIGFAVEDAEGEMQAFVGHGTRGEPAGSRRLRSVD